MRRSFALSELQLRESAAPVTVYVDDMHLYPLGQFRRMKMSHMVADTLDELHAMAARIGVARRWFQDKLSGPHYDIALSKRALAVRYGAREITLRQCSWMCSNARVLGHLGDPATAEALWRALREVRQRARA